MSAVAEKIKFKKTGIEWMPEIPEHWEVFRLKNLCNEKLQYGINIEASKYKSEGIRLLRITDIKDNGIVSEDGIYIDVSPENEAYILRKGDLLFSRSGTIGRCYLHSSEKKYCYAGFLVRFRPKAINLSEWIYYFSFTHYFKKQVYSEAIESTIQNFNGNKFANIYLPIPPKHEQDEIVQYIKAKEEKINLFIQKKQRFIELLKEQRQSIITNAVTKGIDDGVKMKETGIDWMPEVPEHWEIRRLKTIVSGATNGVWGSEPKNNDEDIVCIRVADIDTINYGIDTSNLTRRSISVNDQQGRLLSFGDLIIEKSGGGEISPVGRVVIFNQEIKAVTSNFMGRLNINHNVYNEFLYYLFATLYANRINIPSIKATTGIQNLDLYSYLQNRVPIPPLEEQKRIVEHIKTETRILDIAISKAEREIELIKEYREATIAEAVTGKIVTLHIK